MVDFLSPGTKVIQRRKGPVVLPGIATAIGGFLCYTQKGEIGKPYLVTGPDDAAELLGDRIITPGNGRMTDALQDYFGQGGSSCYVMRYCGTGSAAGARNVSSTGGATAGSLTSSAASFPVALVHGETFIGSVDAVAQGTVTISATKAFRTGVGATFAAVVASGTLVVLVAGIPGNQTITFDGTEASLAAFLTQINNQLRGGRAIASGGQIRIESDILGTSSTGSIISGTADVLASTGHSVGAFTAGTGNVATVDAVTAAEIKTLFDATFTGTGAKTSLTTINANGGVTWASTSATGVLSSVQLTGGTGVAKVAGFDNLLHSGTAVSTVPTATFTASSPGTWANVVGILCTKVDTIVTKATTLAVGAATVVPVLSAARLAIGDTISITKAADTQRGVIKSINGLNVTLVAAITVPAGGYDGTQNVINETFDVTVYNADGTVFFPSPFRNLRMSTLAGANYFVNAINAAARTPIIAANLVAVAADPRPATDTAAALMTGGLDGIAPTASDVIARIADWDKAEDVSFISIPGACTDFTGANGVAILKAQEAYVELRADLMAIVDLPKSTPATGSGGVKEYAQITANLASSYEAIYWPWPMRLSSLSGIVEAFPPSPFVQGIIARTHANRNFGKAPAGIEDGQLLGINDLETKIAEGSAAYNDFYPIGVNAILKFAGQGFAIWGSRTMDSTGEFGQVNVQTVFNVNKRLCKTKTRFVNFENNDADTRASVQRVLTSTFREQRKSKILQGTKDDEAFYVICDDSNNTPLVIKRGKLITRVGLAVNSPSEFVEFTFEQDTRAVDRALAALGT